jgi:rubrerythrin
MVDRILAKFGLCSLVVTTFNMVEIGAQYICGACKKSFYFMDVSAPNYCPLCGAKNHPAK